MTNTCLRDLLNGTPTQFVYQSDLADGPRSKDTPHAVLPAEGDPVLYAAYRDCFKPVRRGWPRQEFWRADLVRYSGGHLLNAEPCRSIGHWNPPLQLEAFEVLAGEVLMLVVPPAGDLECLIAKPNESWLVPAGAFHLTYSIQEAVVLNIYNTGEVASLDAGKYKRGVVPPFRIKLIDKNYYITSESDAAWRARAIDFPPRICRLLSASLSALHFGTDAEIARAFA